MAVITELLPQKRFGVGCVSAVKAVFSFLLAISTAQSRVRQIESLCSKSDEELAARSLRCQDIMRHVYRDVYYV